MTEVSICVLGRSTNEIGDNLESQIKELLAKLGYGSFIRNAYKTGAEIDLQAKHRVAGSPLLCECKAHNSAINAPSVRLFYSEWSKQRKSDTRLHGIFVSTSGFTGTAKQWHEELASRTRKQFILMEPIDLIQNLVETGFTLHPDAIANMLTERYLMDSAERCWLTISQHGLAWTFLYQLEDGSYNYTIVNGHGQALPNWKCKEIARLYGRKLANARLFGLDLRRNVLMELLKREGLNATVIAGNIKESNTDVNLALNILAKEGRIASDQSGAYRFIRDTVQYVNTAKELLFSEDAIVFLSSPYSREMLVSDQLMSYIYLRYRLGMTTQDKETLSRLLLVSPSAVKYALFADPSRFIRTQEDIQEKFTQQEEREKWLEDHRTSLLRDAFFRVLHDLTEHEFGLSRNLASLGIKRIRIKAKLDATGNEDWKKLSVHSEVFTALAPASGPIEAGSVVSYTDPADFKMWNGQFYLEVEEYVDAERDLYEALDLARKSKNIEQEQAILNNLALVYMRQKQWTKGDVLLKESLVLGSPKWPFPFTNRIICQMELGNKEEGIRIIEDALVLFPDIEKNEIIVKFRKWAQIEESKAV